MADFPGHVEANIDSSLSAFLGREKFWRRIDTSAALKELSYTKSTWIAI